MVLNRNPDNFFAETEQVAFCTAHIVPGIDFTNDPLLAGRIHSYVDTQISRLGGANFHEIPINAPVAQVHNNQRDGMHRQAIPRGRVAYEPNSLGGGCPFQAGAAGFTSFPAADRASDKVRGKPEKFAEHYSRRRCSGTARSEVEKRHIAKAFRFELSKVQTLAVRERVVATLRNVAEELAAEVAEGLGMLWSAGPFARPMLRPPKAEVTKSPSLSLFARPGEMGFARATSPYLSRRASMRRPRGWSCRSRRARCGAKVRRWPLGDGNGRSRRSNRGGDQYRSRSVCLVGRRGRAWWQRLRLLRVGKRAGARVSSRSIPSLQDDTGDG